MSELKFSWRQIESHTAVGNFDIENFFREHNLESLEYGQTLPERPTDWDYRMQVYVKGERHCIGIIYWRGDDECGMWIATIYQSTESFKRFFEEECSGYDAEMWDR